MQRRRVERLFRTTHRPVRYVSFRRAERCSEVVYGRVFPMGKKRRRHHWRDRIRGRCVNLGRDSGAFQFHTDPRFPLRLVSHPKRQPLGMTMNVNRNRYVLFPGHAFGDALTLYGRLPRPYAFGMVQRHNERRSHGHLLYRWSLDGNDRYGDRSQTPTFRIPKIQYRRLRKPGDRRILLGVFRLFLT